MDVSLTGVSDHIQRFIRELIEINDWIFYKAHLPSEAVDYPVQKPVVTLNQVLRCFGEELPDKDNVNFFATPAKGPHSCGTLQAKLQDSMQFYLGGSGLQLYLASTVEIWYLVNRGVDHNAVKIDTFDRIALIFADGRHRGIRNIIMGDERIDLRLSDEDDDVVSLCVVN